MASDDIDVWLVDLFEADQRFVQKGLTLLSNTEVNRSKRFVFDKDSNHFILRRSVLRLVLAKYLKKCPENIHFSYGLNGKPFVNADKKKWRFNLSYSRNLVVIAVIKDYDIGIDIEYIDNNFPIMDVSNVVCSTEELRLLKSLSLSSQVIYFWRLWTAKEAYLKALGTGLMMDPRRIKTSPLTLADPSKKIELECSSSTWQFNSFTPYNDYQLTLALQTDSELNIRKKLIKLSDFFWNDRGYNTAKFNS